MLNLSCRHLFPLAPEAVYLNHGGYGVTPNPVLEAAQLRSRLLEKDPGYFFSHECRDKWQEIKGMVAKRFGISSRDLALVTNATDAINSILNALKFDPSDEILTTSMTYGAIEIAARHRAQLCGATLQRMELPFPHLTTEQCLEALHRSLTPRTRLVILDHITSKTALILPLKEMVAECHRRNIAVLVDGAHVPGHISFNIADLNPDWYVANLHKWHFVPRGCGFLWASPNRQHGLFPTVLSWETNRPFPDNFEWTGTRDPHAWLAIPDAFGFMDQMGFQALQTHNQKLVRQAVDLLTEAWQVLPTASFDMIGNMAVLPLPANLSLPPTQEASQKLEKHLHRSFHITAPFYAYNERLYVRIAAQIYNDISDYEKLDAAIKTLT